MDQHNKVKVLRELTTANTEFFCSLKSEGRSQNFWPEVYHKSKPIITQEGQVRTYYEENI